MPRTYGELCQCSFADVLGLGGADVRKVLVDCGSGHGVLVKAAVQDHGCTFALGIEKYKEPAAVAEKLFDGSESDVQAKMRFLLEDMNDVDIPCQLDGLAYDTLIIFCNNLAFHEGTVHRCALACIVFCKAACCQAVWAAWLAAMALQMTTTTKSAANAFTSNLLHTEII